MTGYTETIRRYAADDRRTGILDAPDGTGEVGLNAGEAGRRLAVRFTLRLKNDRVESLRYQVFGCGFTIAACAVAAELAEGRSLEEALSIDAAAVNKALDDLPEERAYCADLAVEALRAALQSALGGAAVQTVTHPSGQADHGPRVTADDSLYRSLVDSPAPRGAAWEDRHLFACLFSVAAQEGCAVEAALGLESEDVASILATWFPAFDADRLKWPASHPAPTVNPDVLSILLSHVPGEPSGDSLVASWLARCLAARAAHPGHLWVAMGLFERPELTAAIRRHLPSLALANNKGMRWKRYLFKEACTLGGGVLCKSPNCGICSDYALCFAPEEE